MKWYENHPNYGGMPPNAHAWVYHPQWGLLMSPMGGVHMQALAQVPRDKAYGLTDKYAFGRVYPNGSIGGSQGPYATWYSASADSPYIDEAKQAVEQWTANYHAINQMTKNASLPYKFVWANGQLSVGPGWRADIHHMHLMQNMGLTQAPDNLIAGTYAVDDFTGQPRIKVDWGPEGNVPSDDQLVELIQQQLQQDQHPGRTARKPW